MQAAHKLVGNAVAYVSYVSMSSSILLNLRRVMQSTLTFGWPTSFQLCTVRNEVLTLRTILSAAVELNP